MAIMACCNTFVQAQIHDVTRVYDTVTDADPFYLFSTFKPCFNPGRYDWAPSPVMLQEYIASDTVTIYGVAITVENHFSPTLDANNANTNMRYRALLMDYLGRSPIHNHAFSFELIDSVSLRRAQPRFCWFLYEDSCDNTNSLVAPCYEFYFDSKQINRMTDTFFVGRYRELGVDYYFPEEYGGEYSASLPTNIYRSTGYTGDDLNLFFHCDGYQDRKWGVAFPIIGFRCGPIRQYWLDAYTGDSAVVRWRSVEEGTLYNVRLTGSDGSDTTMVTADTSIVLTQLSDSVRYNVMLRKQCHYATQCYDTTVYGQWLSHIFFGTEYIDTTGGIDTIGGTDTIGGIDTIGGGGGEGIVQPKDGDFVFMPNPARESVLVLLPETALGGKLSLCDLSGSELKKRTITGMSMELSVADLPAGTYLLRITTPMGTVTKKLLVQ